MGTIVAFGAYLTQLYGPIASLTNARVEFATSLVSFERVFEVQDLPLEIADHKDAVSIDRASGHVQFQGVSFNYGERDRSGVFGLQEVERFNRSTMAQVC